MRERREIGRGARAKGAALAFCACWIGCGWAATSCTTWSAVKTALEAGNDAVLAANVTVTEQSDFKTATFDLNGHTVFVPSTLRAFCGTAANVTLTLKDSAGGGLYCRPDGDTGKFTADSDSYGGAFVLLKNGSKMAFEGGTVKGFANETFSLLNGTLRMTGGTISGCSSGTSSSAGRGAAVYVCSASTFEMSGGIITNCSVVGSGGAVYVIGAFTMNGGVIDSCSASALTGDNGHGGAIFVEGGAFTMNGGTIRNCKSPLGAAFQVGGWGSSSATGTAKIFGGTFSGNTATEHGAIYNQDKGVITICGGAFTNNVCAADGTVFRTWSGGKGSLYLYGCVCDFQPSAGSEVVASWGEYGERQLGSAWIVGKNITTEEGTTRLTGGTFAFDPSEARYAAMGIALADDLSVVTSGSDTARTATIAALSVPGTRLVNYQGYLADPATGKVYADGVYTLDCRLWNAPSGTAGCLWGARHSVYVKDGSFNVLLGSPNSRGLTAEDGAAPAYGRDQLAEAIISGGTAIYLGVTLHQDAQGAALAAPAEVVPRQKIVSVPFASRALSAKYADEAPGDFAVKGKVSVTGTTTVKGAFTATSTETQRFGPIVTSGSEVLLSGTKTPSASLPNIYAANASGLNILSWGDMLFKTTTGDITTRSAHGYANRVLGAGSFVSTLPTTTINGSGATKITGGSITLQAGSANITYKQSGTEAKISGGSTFKVATPAQITASSQLTVKGSTASIGSTTTDGAQLQVSGNTVTGSGNLRWTSDGTEYAPFVFLEYGFALYDEEEDAWQVILPNDATKRNKYKWYVVGAECVDYKDDDQHYALASVYISEETSGSPKLHVAKGDRIVAPLKLNQGYGVECVVVHVMGVLKEWH